MHHPTSYPEKESKRRRQKKMVPHFNDKYDKVGKRRLRQIHTRVNYLAKECGFMDTDTPSSFKLHGL